MSVMSRPLTGNWKKIGIKKVLKLIWLGILDFILDLDFWLHNQMKVILKTFVGFVPVANVSSWTLLWHE